MKNEQFAMTDLLPAVLDIVVHHHVCVQSETMDYDETKRVEASKIKANDTISSGTIICGDITVQDISNESVTILYGDKSRTLRLGEEWTADQFVVDNSPYPNSDEITMTISYDICTPWMQIPEIMEKILAVHEKSDSSVIAETAVDEQRVLALIELELECGNVGNYPLYALLSACNNWHSAVIVRLGLFQQILLEGIEKGALAPDDDEGWSWMKVAAETNDPETFMTDMDRYYNLLASAVENGNQDANEIMDMIWEPENCQEED